MNTKHWGERRSNVMSSEGWMVVRHGQTDRLMLLQGIRPPWGYVLIAWTAGNRNDGRTLLAETIAKELGLKEAK